MIEATGETLGGIEKPFAVAEGIPPVPDRLATEDDPPIAGWSPRVFEYAVVVLAARDVHASVVRLPHVHDRDRQRLASYLIDIARPKCVSAYVGTDSIAGRQCTGAMSQPSIV